MSDAPERQVLEGRLQTAALRCRDLLSL